MESEILFFRQFIKKKGLRYTNEREAVARAVLARRDHFDVEELYLSVQAERPVSKASIYRTIPLLIEAGLLAEVFHEDGHMHYEPMFGRGHHCHLRCTQCREVKEFSDHRLIEIERDMGLKFGFAVEGHKLEIFGLCPDCQQKGKEDP